MCAWVGVYSGPETIMFCNGWLWDGVTTDPSTTSWDDAVRELARIMCISFVKLDRTHSLFPPPPCILIVSLWTQYIIFLLEEMCGLASACARARLCIMLHGILKKNARDEERREGSVARVAGVRACVCFVCRRRGSWLMRAERKHIRSGSTSRRTSCL